MADRLSQLQDAINVQADNLCNSIGLLQQFARPNKFPEFDLFSRNLSSTYKQTLVDGGVLHTNSENGSEIGKTSDELTLNDPDLPDNGKLFAELITKTAQHIDIIIDSLPSREMEPELQEVHIRRLEIENSSEAKRFECLIDCGEELLKDLNSALDDIAQNQMMMKQLEAKMLLNTENDKCPFT